MASIDDVSGALKSAVITALNTLPIANTIDVMVGWPNMPALTKLLEQDRSVVSIVPLPTEKLTTRFFPISYIIAQPTNSLAVTVGQSVANTWNPADKNANVTLSNANLTATFAYTSSVAVRASLGVSSGKWYWEVVFSPGYFQNTPAIGVGTSAATLDGFVGTDAFGWGYYAADGDIYHSGIGAAYGATFTHGDVIGVALDMDAGTLTFYKNGASQGVAVTGLTGTLFPMASDFDSAASTANFGATAFAYAPPAGYSPYDGVTITFSGSVMANLNVMTVVNTNTPFASPALYQTTNSDTLDTVATGAAAAVNALGLSGVSASASGAVLTVTGISGLVCNVGGVGTVGQEVRRTERQFQISTFTPGDAQTSLTAVSTSRSMIVNAIDQALASIYFLQFPDTSYGRLKYVRGPWNDDMQRETMLISNQIFSVEFATLATALLAQVTAVEITETPTLPNGQPGPSVTFTVGN